MSELVSVVITTYMRPAEIVFRAIKSVCNQTYPNIEIIVVDDSPSTYEGRCVVQNEIERFPYKITYIQHATNLGACAARNTGLNASNGTYIAFLDDDDEWLPEKIEYQIKEFQDENTALVYCGKIVVNDITGQRSDVKGSNVSGYIYETLIFRNFIGSTSFPLIRRNALLEVGGFDPMMKSAQDYDLWLRLARKYKVACVEQPLVRYHVHGEERISTNYQARISGQERLIEKNIEYLLQNEKAWWWRLLRLSIQYSQGKQLSKAIQVWYEGCRKQPLEIVTNLNYLIHILFYYVKNTCRMH